MQIGPRKGRRSSILHIRVSREPAAIRQPFGPLRPNRPFVVGLEILENLSASGHYQYGAKTALAVAIRKRDPVRARSLLEEALRSDPGGATAPLAEVLIAGKGGLADPNRAPSLLHSNRNVPAVKGMLGRLRLEGKLLPRDAQEAMRLIGIASVWNFDARQQVVQLLAAYTPILKCAYRTPSTCSTKPSRPQYATNPAQFRR